MGKTVIGTMMKKRRGYGFVSCEEMEKDVFVPKVLMRGAMDGDTVEVELLQSGSGELSSRGAVRSIRKRKLTRVAGLFRVGKKYCEIIPEGGAFQEPLRIRKRDAGGAEDGDHAVAEILRYPDRHRPAEGRVTEILARAGQPGGEILSIAANYGLTAEYPNPAEQEAERAAQAGLTDAALAGREDLRDQLIFTIDGPDARDFDDAVSLRMQEDGTRLLGIHIADVAHYVEEDGALDREARLRGTSTYFPSMVIPMLPEALSCGSCSLQPASDRLTVSLEITVDPAGSVTEHRIFESVIRSRARLVYDDVSDLLEEARQRTADGAASLGRDQILQMLTADPAARVEADPEELMQALTGLEKLAEELRGRREARGSIDFDLDEAMIRLDAAGRPVEIGISDRRTANRLIEDLMILANETVAEEFYWLGAPFIHRVHESPEPGRVSDLRTFLRNLGIPLRGNSGDIHPAAFRSVLDQIRGTSYENAVSTIVLRTMQKACYSSSCTGHFGLASTYYCHFTSPIRRYPDLFIHRVIKAWIRAQSGADPQAAEQLPEVFRQWEEISDAVAASSSAAERRSTEAEREVEKLKKTEYMVDHIGEEFPGVISGITSFGLYVQLENTVEGLIHITELFDDYYEPDRDRYALVGARTKKRYRLGDRIMIVVESADPAAREIRFLPV